MYDRVGFNILITTRLALLLLLSALLQDDCYAKSFTYIADTMDVLESLPPKDRLLLESLFDENEDILLRLPDEDREMFLHFMGGSYGTVMGTRYGLLTDPVAMLNKILKLVRKFLPQSYARAVLSSNVVGVPVPLAFLLITEEGGAANITGVMIGLKLGLHGMHIHSGSSCDDLGAHYDSSIFKTPNHGGLHTDPRHTGDLGNIQAGFVVTQVSIDNANFRLSGKYGVIGKAISVKANQDDLGQGGDAESLISGNAGDSVRCGIIEELIDIPTV